MKFKLCKDCELVEQDNNLIISNKKYNSELILNNVNKLQFNNILNGEMFKDITYKLSIEDNYITLNKLKEFNEVVYTLLEQKVLEYNNEYSKNGRKIWLKSCLLELTDMCNFRCPHCYVDKQNFNKVSFESVKEIAKELLSLNCNKITLTGGEVLTHNEFTEIYKYLYKCGFIIGINTNGSLFNEKIIDLLIEMPPYSVEISLYGYDETSYHDFTLTSNSFNKVVNNINILKNNNIKVILKNIITNSNKNYFSKIRKLALDLGVEFRSDYLSFPQINGRFKQNPEQISVEDTINSLKNQDKVKDYFINLYNSYKQDDGYVFKCKQMDDAIFINSKLDVCMCICLQSISYKYAQGNLLDCILKLQDFRKMKYNNDNKCKNCRLISICRYCPAKFYLTTGDYQKAPQWFCDYSNAVYNNFIKGFNILRKRYLLDFELNKMFDIISNNMINIGINITDKDKDMWVDNLMQNLKQENFYFYSIYFNGEICGFIELSESDNKLIISEIQLNNEIKGSKAILYILDFIIKIPYLQKHNKVYFSINKNNVISNKTFTHLGARIVLEKEKSFKYEIDMEDVKIYLNNLLQYR